ncbi:hypothetical protein LAZ67_6003332 [Cordylochernes scorpioides]|uniref:Uncharacterized protein n=1 Tax=Cordylochernes scorpioides TaxID=51811 RepID=A0ABY6KKJ1_9ARAC|nr:hypothetical protein LAZ67_6003332 [Cordylochernes scorpioides]
MAVLLVILLLTATSLVEAMPLRPTVLTATPDRGETTPLEISSKFSLIHVMNKCRDNEVEFEGTGGVEDQSDQLGRSQLSPPPHTICGRETDLNEENLLQKSLECKLLAIPLLATVLQDSDPGLEFLLSVFEGYVVDIAGTQSGVALQSCSHTLLKNLLRVIVVYDDHALAKRMCQKWFARLKSGNIDLEDEERPRAPLKFEGLMKIQHKRKRKEIAKTLGVTQPAIFHCLKEMGMIRKVGNWVPYELKPRDVERCFFYVNNCSNVKKERGFCIEL